MKKQVWPPILNLQEDKARQELLLGDNCIQNFHLGRYIVGYRVRNLVLKRDLQTYIQRYTSLNENFE